MAKGNDFEWVIAKLLSKWLTGSLVTTSKYELGKDTTQLVRSVLSGGSTRLRSLTAARPEYQVGDLAPNGPLGEEFRRRFGVECKNYHDEPEWWHCLNSKNWVVEQWWNKILGECLGQKLLFQLDPFLVMRKDNKPIVVGMRDCWPYEILNGEVIHFPNLGMKVIRLDRILEKHPTEFFRFHDSLLAP